MERSQEGLAQTWEDRAHPLALPQREAVEGHGSGPIRQLVFQFLLCPLWAMEPWEGLTWFENVTLPAPAPLLTRDLGDVSLFLIWFPQAPLFIPKWGLLYFMSKA